MLCSIVMGFVRAYGWRQNDVLNNASVSKIALIVVKYEQLVIIPSIAVMFVV